MIDPAFWFSAPGIAVVVLCTAIGAAITARLWLTRTSDPVIPKIIWSLVIVLLPVLGWMLTPVFIERQVRTVRAIRTTTTSASPRCELPSTI